MSDADERLQQIEEKLLNLERIASNSVVDSEAIDAALQAYQSQLLVKLKQVRETLIAEGGDIATIRQERDSALLQNAALKKDNERLQYRVKHLIKMLNEEESKNLES